MHHRIACPECDTEFCTDCADGECPYCEGSDECEEDLPSMYLIEMAWWCWDCAENIGQSFIEKERPRVAGDKCYGCEQVTWVNSGK
jgi:hypothetical protein